MTSNVKHLDPVQGLVDYVLDIKPYHTKIMEVLFEYVHNEPVDVIISDAHTMHIDLFQPTSDELSLFCEGGYASRPFGDYNRYPIISPNQSIDYPAISGGSSSFTVPGDRSTDLKTGSQVYIVTFIDIFIDAVDFNLSTFTIQGDHTATLTSGVVFEVVGSYQYDGYYTLSVDSTFDETNTTLTVVQDLDSTIVNARLGSVRTPGNNTGIFTVSTAVFNGGSIDSWPDAGNPTSYLLGDDPHTVITVLETLNDIPALESNQVYLASMTISPVLIEGALYYSNYLELYDPSGPTWTHTPDEGFKVEEIIGVTLSTLDGVGYPVPDSGKFVVSGNLDESNIFVGNTLKVGSSAGNNGTYTISSIAYDGGTDETTLGVENLIDSSTVDGNITIDIASNVFIVHGDFRTRFTQGVQFNIAGGNKTGTYTTLSSDYVDDKTRIRVMSDIFDTDVGYVILSTTGGFVVTGDLTSAFPVDAQFNVVGSTQNDGSYVVASAGPTYNSVEHETTIPIDTAIDSTAGGNVHPFVVGVIKDTNYGYSESSMMCGTVPETMVRVVFGETLRFGGFGPSTLTLTDDIIAYNLENTDSGGFELPLKTITSATQPDIPEQSTPPAETLNALWFDTTPIFVMPADHIEPGNPATDVYVPSNTFKQYTGYDWGKITTAWWFDTANDLLYYLTKNGTYTNYGSGDVLVDTGWVLDFQSTSSGVPGYSQVSPAIGETEYLDDQIYVIGDLGGGVPQDTFTLDTTVPNTDKTLINIVINGVPAEFTLNSATEFTIISPLFDVDDIVQATIYDRTANETNAHALGMVTEPHMTYHEFVTTDAINNTYIVGGGNFIDRFTLSNHFDAVIEGSVTTNSILPYDIASFRIVDVDGTAETMTIVGEYDWLFTAGNVFKVQTSENNYNEFEVSGSTSSSSTVIDSFTAQDIGGPAVQTEYSLSVSVPYGLPATVTVTVNAASVPFILLSKVLVEISDTDVNIGDAVEITIIDDTTTITVASTVEEVPIFYNPGVTIYNIDNASNTIIVNGNVVDVYTAGLVVQVSNSTVGNNGEWTVASANYDSGNDRTNVLVGNIPDLDMYTPKDVVTTIDGVANIIIAAGDVTGNYLPGSELLISNSTSINNTTWTVITAVYDGSTETAITVVDKPIPDDLETDVLSTNIKIEPYPLRSPLLHTPIFQNYSRDLGVIWGAIYDQSAINEKEDDHVEYDPLIDGIYNIGTVKTIIVPTTDVNTDVTGISYEWVGPIRMELSINRENALTGTILDGIGVSDELIAVPDSFSILYTDDPENYFVIGHTDPVSSLPVDLTYSFTPRTIFDVKGSYSNSSPNTLETNDAKYVVLQSFFDDPNNQFIAVGGETKVVWDNFNTPYNLYKNGILMDEGTDYATTGINEICFADPTDCPAVGFPLVGGDVLVQVPVGVPVSWATGSGETFVQIDTEYDNIPPYNNFKVVAVSNNDSIQSDSYQSIFEDDTPTISIGFSYNVGSGELDVTRDGLLQTVDVDYTETSSTSITWVGPPPLGTNQQFGTYIFDDTVATPSIIPIPFHYTGGSGSELQVFIASVQQTEGVDYNITDEDNIEWIGALISNGTEITFMVPQVLGEGKQFGTYPFDDSVATPSIIPIPFHYNGTDELQVFIASVQQTEGVDYNIIDEDNIEWIGAAIINGTVISFVVPSIIDMSVQINGLGTLTLLGDHVNLFSKFASGIFRLDAPLVSEDIILPTPDPIGRLRNVITVTDIRLDAGNTNTVLTVQEEFIDEAYTGDLGLIETVYRGNVFYDVNNITLPWVDGTIFREMFRIDQTDDTLTATAINDQLIFGWGTVVRWDIVVTDRVANFETIDIDGNPGTTDVRLYRGSISIAGDQTGAIELNDRFNIRGSTGNDGEYEVATKAYNAGNNDTDIIPRNQPRTHEVTTVDDVAGNLDGTYFRISTPSEQYYVWMQVDNSIGSDPAPPATVPPVTTPITPTPPDPTGIRVRVPTNATSDTVAANLEYALTKSGVFYADLASTIIVPLTTDGILTDIDLITGTVVSAQGGFSVVSSGDVVEITQNGASYQGSYVVISSDSDTQLTVDTSGRPFEGQTVVDLYVTLSTLDVVLIDNISSGEPQQYAYDVDTGFIVDNYTLPRQPAANHLGIFELENVDITNWFQYLIQQMEPIANEIVVLGNALGDIQNGQQVRVVGTNNNNSTFTVSSLPTYDTATATTVTPVTETINYGTNEIVELLSSTQIKTLGNCASFLDGGDIINIVNSSGNDGTYVIDGVEYINPYSILTISSNPDYDPGDIYPDNLPNVIPDGDVQYVDRGGWVESVRYNGMNIYHEDFVGVTAAENVDAVVLTTGLNFVDSWDANYWDLGSFDESLGTVIHLYSSTF